MNMTPMDGLKSKEKTKESEYNRPSHGIFFSYIPFSSPNLNYNYKRDTKIIFRQVSVSFLSFIECYVFGFSSSSFICLTLASFIVNSYLFIYLFVFPIIPNISSSNK
jgi:hypothetical protein